MKLAKKATNANQAIKKNGLKNLSIWKSSDFDFNFIHWVIIRILAYIQMVLQQLAS